jgi:hypothetical protein
MHVYFLQAENVIQFLPFCKIYCQPLERENKAKLKFMMNTVNLVRHSYKQYMKETNIFACLLVGIYRGAEKPATGSQRPG